MELKIFTLKSGISLLGETEVNNDNTISNEIVIKQPVQVITQQTQQGPMIGFAMFLDYTEEFKTGISINSSEIITINTPVIELKNEYNKIFGNGFVIANQMPT